MTRRRRRSHASLFALVVTLAAVAFVGALVWRLVYRSAKSRSVELPRSYSAQPVSAATPDNEHFTTSERQGLEEILKRKPLGSKQ